MSDTDNKKFDFLVFILRGQPFHIGHQEVVEHALTLAKQVFILLGSAHQARTIKNPWNYENRKQMINSVFPDNKQISIYPLTDFKTDNNIWAANVQRIVKYKALNKLGWTDFPPVGGIIGHTKDESSFYLQLFPQWQVVEHPLNEEVNATDIRRIYFEDNIRYLRHVMPETVYDMLVEYKKTAEYLRLKDEWETIKRYKQSWASAPYEPTFLTADAVVIQSGHVLLIQRRASPGKNLWALPGGFVNTKERIEDAALRELQEETKIDVPLKVLRGNIKSSKVFDDPTRSLRGRTVTHAFFIELPPGPLPRVKGSDDAKKAKWVPISEVIESELFEDHFSIVESFIGRMP